MTLEEVIRKAFYDNNCGGNHTVCPECHVDDFVHIEGCKNVGLDNAISTAISAWLKDKIVPEEKKDARPGSENDGHNSCRSTMLKRLEGK